MKKSEVNEPVRFETRMNTMKLREKYGIRDGFDLKYQDRLVAFLDILGFRNLVFDQNKIELLDFIVNLVPDMLKSAKGSLSSDSVAFTAISDSIILSTPTSQNPDPELNDLGRLCILINRIQYELAMSGIWLRGAISVGPLFHNPKTYTLVGPAYINAYDLEKAAVGPRIIIDPRLLTYYGISGTDLLSLNSSGAEYILGGNLIFASAHKEATSLRIDGDQFCFLDYLSIFSARELSHGRFLDGLRLSLEESKTREKDFKKHLWTARYAKITLEDNLKRDDGAHVAKCLELINSLIGQAEAR
jgi:hypothetical protein